MIKQGYTILPVDINDDRNFVIELWNDNFPDSSGFDYKYQWLYQSNIYPGTFIYFLLHDDSQEKIGAQGVSGRIFEYNGEKLAVGLIGDFAVNSHHRSLWPAMKLLKSTLKKSVGENDFIISYPNLNALPVVKRAGYKLHMDVNRYVKINKINSYLKKRIPAILAMFIAPLIDFIIITADTIKYIKYSQNIEYEFCNSISKDVDELWETSIFKNNCLIQERIKKYIDWRMDGEENLTTRFFVIKNKSDQSMLGYISYYYIEETNSILIVDFFAKDKENILKSLFSMFVYRIRCMDAVSISVEFIGTDDIDIAIKNSGFRKRDSRPMFYVFNEKRIETLSTKNWFLTSWDEDAI